MQILFSILILWAGANDSTCVGIWDIGEARQRKQESLVQTRAKKQGIPPELAKQQIDLESVRDFLFAGRPKDVEFIRFHPTHIADLAKYPVSEFNLTVVRNRDLTDIIMNEPVTRHPEIPGANDHTTIFLQAFATNARERNLINQFMPAINQGFGIAHSQYVDIKVHSPHRLERVIEIRENYEPISYHYMLTFVKKENGELKEVRLTRNTTDEPQRVIRFLDENP